MLPSVIGLELYGWAHGLPGLSPAGFPALAAASDPETAIPRLTSVLLPNLRGEAVA